MIEIDPQLARVARGDPVLGHLRGRSRRAPLQLHVHKLDVMGFQDSHFTFATGLNASLWLFLLAIGSQVIGWLLIGVALPKLPVVETSVLLLGQPVFTVIWGVLLFDERLSSLQWAGSAIVLAGVAALSLQRR